MTKIIKLLFFCSFSLLITLHTSAQDEQKKLTADEIVQRAINNNGGAKKLDSLKASESIFLIMSGKDTASVAIKRNDFNKYIMSRIGTNTESSTIVFNSGNAMEIRNDVASKITDPLKLEDLLLQCYGQIDYGFKKLGYKFSRLDDQRYRIFDCYVIQAVSPSGKKLSLYYDKNSGNNIMIKYPNGSSMVFVDYYDQSGVNYPATIEMTDSTFATSKMLLQKIEHNAKPDASWFLLPAEGPYVAPEQFRTGTFRFVGTNSKSIIIRDKEKQTENNGRISRDYTVKWLSGNEYVVTAIEDGKSESAKEPIKVRIVTWDGDKIYCHHINSKNVGRTSVFEKSR
jgi:hypothetical protein